MESNIFDVNKVDLKKALSIEASAGTGKTHNICEIVKRLLFEYDGYSLDNILIVTYTDKATEELKNRIRKAVLEKVSEAKKDVNLDKMSVFTIHSFCESVLKEFGVEMNLPLDLEIASERKMLDDFLDYYLRDTSIFSEIEIIKGIDLKFNFDELKATLINVLDKYYLDINNKVDEKIISLKDDDAFSYIDKLWLDAKEQGTPFDCFYNEAKAFKYYYDILSSSNLDKAKGLTLAIKDFINDEVSFDLSTFRVSKTWSDLEKEAYNYFKEFRNHINKGINFNKYLIYKYVDDIYIRYEEKKKELKKESFNDLLKCVRESVINNEEFKKKLQEKYKYAIIDEFQDTNMLQYDIFKNIFLNVEGHNLVVVGDPKQSIYSFQGADLNVYQEAVSEINNKEILDNNFRSRKEVVASCNKYFGGDFFNESISFYDSATPNSRIKMNAKYKGEDIKGLIIAGGVDAPLSPSEYAKVIVERIVDYCKKEKGKTNLTLIDKDGKENNVSFSSFCILYRTKSEASYIINELNRCGIPSVRYKDKNLLNGRECKNFITILKAIDAIDFTGKRRRLFRTALFTDFFGKSINEISSKVYDRDDSKEMGLINEWKYLARSKRYDELIGGIIEKSNLYDNLKDISDNKILIKYLQIADIAIDYLYNNHTISDLINYLNKEMKSSSDDDSEVVEIGTDFDAVRLMTIHASKGLEFPICFFFGGFKNKNTKAKVFTYHDEDGKRKISFDSSDERCDLKEEWKRLIYVAFTRCKYLLMIPYFKEGKRENIYLSTLNEATFNYQKNFIDDYEIVEYSYPDYLSIRRDVKEILRKETTVSFKAEEQKMRIKELIPYRWSKGVFKHSYSSLSHGHDEDSEEKNLEGVEVFTINKADSNAIVFIANLDETKEALDTPIDFPKGAEIGSALHEVFEKATFTDYSLDNYNDNSSKLDTLINESLDNYNVNCNSEGISYIKNMVFNVLNSDFIEIKGSDTSNKFFKLSSIKDVDKLAETEFNFNLLNEKLKNYCNGFIDLVFRRGDYYSILDWKSDSINDDDLTNYGLMGDLINHTDSRYSIQRVLYSYCLINYLSEVLGKTKEEVFKENFGGIYYVYLRGCRKDYSNGIYAQSWDSYKTLEEAFNNIVKEKIGGTDES